MLTGLHSLFKCVFLISSVARQKNLPLRFCSLFPHTRVQLTEFVFGIAKGSQHLLLKAFQTGFKKARAIHFSVKFTDLSGSTLQKNCCRMRKMSLYCRYGKTIDLRKLITNIIGRHMAPSGGPVVVLGVSIALTFSTASLLNGQDRAHITFC